MPATLVSDRALTDLSHIWHITHALHAQESHELWNSLLTYMCMYVPVINTECFCQPLAVHKPESSMPDNTSYWMWEAIC